MPSDCVRETGKRWCSVYAPAPSLVTSYSSQLVIYPSCITKIQKKNPSLQWKLLLPILLAGSELTKTRAWLLGGITRACLRAHEFPSKRFEIGLGAGALRGQEKQTAVADGIPRCAEQGSSAAPELALGRADSVRKCKYFLSGFVLCGLGHGAGTLVAVGGCSAGSAQRLPLHWVQRVFWEAPSQSRLLIWPVCGLYDPKHRVSVWEGGWKQVCFISSIIMWPCKTA